jgi:hypothetical protein
MNSCNFCGFDEGWVKPSPFNKEKYVVVCSVCGAVGPESTTYQGAERKWNGFLKTIDMSDKRTLQASLDEDMGGVSSPASTLTNTPGMGTVCPASTAATTGSQQYSINALGSGDKWTSNLKPAEQLKTKKKKTILKKKKTNENFYPSIKEEQINPYDKLGTAMAKKLKVTMNFKKGKNQTVHQKSVLK